MSSPPATSSSTTMSSFSQHGSSPFGSSAFQTPSSEAGSSQSSSRNSSRRSSASSTASSSYSSSYADDQEWELAEEARVNEEWEESKRQMQTLVSIVLLPFFGKWYGRRFAYSLYAKYQKVGLAKELLGWS